MPHSQRASAGRMACAVVLLAGLTVISPVALGQGGLDNGQNHTGAIAAAGQTVTWTFAANAGDAISLAIGEVTDTGSFWPWIRLLRPDGTQIGSGYGALTGHIDIAAAPLTGVYSVLVASGDSGRIGTGSYRLTLAKTPGAFVVPAGDEGGAMTNGENHAGAIHLGDLDMWTFQANAGDAITLSIGEVTDSGSFWPWIRLRSPTGAQIGSGYGALTGHIDVAAAPLTGTYTVVVASADSGSNGTGTYRLTLAKTPGNFVVPSGDEGGAMTNGANHTGAIHLGDLDQWTFQANAGDAISVSIGETADNGSFWPWIRLRAPNGAQLGSGYGALSGHINVAAAPQTGTYTVVVTSADSGSNGTGAYRLNMAKSPGTFVVPSGDEGGTMTNGANHTGAIQLADLDQWSFQANAGDAISVSVGETTDTGSFWPWIRLRAPNGAQLGSGYGALSGHINVASAPQTGTYTVVVASADSGSNGTGTYHLTLAKTPGAFVVPSGDQGGPLTVGPNNPGAIFLADLDQWTLQARAGDTIDLSISETADAGSFWPWIRLRGPTGIQYGSAYGASSAQIHIASAALTGTYTVVVASADSGSNGAGSYLLTSSHAGTSVTPPARNKSLGPDCVGNVACGNPINITSGNKYQEVTDYETAGANKLRFTRYYNSLSDLNGSPSILGKAWRSTFDRTLYFLSPTSLIAERETGRTLTFHLSAGKWTPDSDVDLKLTQSGSGAGSTWTLTDSGDTVETYHALTADSAVLTAIQARGGYTQTLTRDASGVLQTVTDSFGRSLQFAYQDGFLRTLTTPDTLSLTYGYTSPNGAPDRLTSVAYSTAPATSQTYLYENTSLPYALTGITDENGGRFATWTYDAAGRARLSQHNAGADRVLAAYNANGTRTVTNALGQQEIYTFSILQGVRKVIRINRLATPKTPAAVRAFTYDANGYLSSETDWKGRQTTYVNDARGLPLTITEAVGTSAERVTTIAYDPAFHVPTSIVEPGVTTEFTYDGAGNLLTRTLTDTTTTTIPYPTNGAKRVWTYTWGANGLLASVRGPRTALNQLKSFTYDGSGTLIQTTDALGHQIRVTQHTGGGLPLTIVDANGLTTELTYDDRLRLKTSTITLAGGPRTTTYDYDAVGNLTKVILPDGSFLSGTYDLAHRLTTVRDRLNQTVSYSLDLSGNRTQTVFRNSSSVVTRTKSAEYDALGRLIEVTAGAGQVTRIAYDTNGNAITITDPLSRATQQLFDARNRRFRVTDAAGGISSTVFDAHGRPLSVTDANGVITRYVYNGFGDMIQSVSPDAGTTVYKYDLGGNLIQRIDPRGIVENHTYDVLDRRTSTKYPAGASANVTYKYDEAGHGSGAGRLTSLTDPAGTLSLVYEKRGKLVSSIRNRGGVVLTTAYAYDAAGRIASIAYPSGALAAYARDMMGQVKGVTYKPAGAGSPQTLVSNVAYEPFGPIAAFTFGNNIAATRSFDLDYRLTNLSDGNIQNLTHTYDAADNVLTIQDSISSTENQAFGYDAVDRLTSATGIYGSRAYTYDAGGNRLTQVANGSASTYSYAPSANRLTEALSGGTTQQLAYTAAGAVKSINYVPNSQPQTGLTYGLNGRLAVVTSGAQAVLSYLYDAFGHRSVKTGLGGAVTLYQYDEAGHLLEEASGAGAAKIDYIYVDDLPVAAFLPGTSQLMFVHTGRLGTPRRLTDGARNVVWRANYEPFGTLHAPSSQTTAVAQNLRFPGQEFETETGWNQNGFRDYAPWLGRYLESDPIGLVGGLDTYGYARSNPVNSIDPAGLVRLNLVSITDWRGYWTMEAYQDPKYFTVGAHGYGPRWGDAFRSTHVSGGGWWLRSMNVEDVGDLLLESDWNTKYGPHQPVRLAICFAGNGSEQSFAARLAAYLAEKTNAPVSISATPNFVEIDSLGRISPNTWLDFSAPSADPVAGQP